MRCLLIFVIFAAGCAAGGREPSAGVPIAGHGMRIRAKSESSVRLASYQNDERQDADAGDGPELDVSRRDETSSDIDQKDSAAESETPWRLGEQTGLSEDSQSLFDSDDAGTLAQLETEAINRNPMLVRITREYEAVRARSRYVGELPDPTIGGNVFISPIETAAGSQRANLTFSQKVPSLARLDAQTQQACLEAMAIQQVYMAERLKLVSEIRTRWFKLYLIARKLEATNANQQLLETLVEVANSKVATGEATKGDVLAGTVDLGKLQEQVLSLRRQRESTVAEMNRLVGRDAAVPIESPSRIDGRVPDWNHDMLRSIAWQQQPEVIAASIRTKATHWGLEVARLKRRPDFTLNTSWFGIEGNRPTSNIVDVGRDAWAIGASMTLPINRRKYDAIEREASWKHQAAHASVEQTKQRYDALLRDLWEQAKAADETATLYKDSILPQARDTVEADQESYANGEVEFDRLIRNVRNLLTLEVSYHKSISEAASSLARIRQACGTELSDYSDPPRTFPIELDNADAADAQPAKDSTEEDSEASPQLDE